MSESSRDVVFKLLIDSGRLDVGSSLFKKSQVGGRLVALGGNFAEAFKNYLFQIRRDILVKL